MVKVSVIMPVYNTNPEFFIQAVNSALSQTLCNIELIIVDDGSDDVLFKDTINEVSKSDKRIKLFSKPHEGSGQARNLGIALSNGGKISFLDSDDFYPDNNTLRMLSDIIDEKKVLVAGGKPIEYEKDGTFSDMYFNYGNIDDFFFTDDDKYIIYTTNVEDNINLYYYNLKKDPIKIDTSISSIKDYTNSYLLYTKDDSLYYQMYKDLMIKGMIISKNYVDDIVNIAEIMSKGSKMPCFYNKNTDDILKQFRERFYPNKKDEEFIKIVDNMIDASYDNFRTNQYDYFQKLTNGIIP